MLANLLAATQINDKAQASQLLAELDNLRDDFDRKVDAARSEMRRLAGAAIVGTRAYQRHADAIGLVLLAIAVLLGMTVAGAVTLGLVRPSAQWIGIRSLCFAFLSISRLRHSRRQSMIQRPMRLRSISLTGFYEAPWEPRTCIGLGKGRQVKLIGNPPSARSSSPF